MNSRTLNISFVVLCVVLSVCLISVQSVYASDKIKIDEPGELNFFELQSTVTEIHPQNHYLMIASEKIIGLVDSRRGRKRFRTIRILDLTKGAADSADTTYCYYNHVVAGLIALKQKVANKLSITVGGRHEIDDYNISTNFPGRKPDFYQADAEIGYQITKWLHAGISYTYKENNASNNNFADYDYKNNQTMFNITGSF